MTIKENLKYTEYYNEMRRFRDYELTASTWYSAILLAILGFIISEKFNPKSSLAHLLSMNTSAEIFVAIVVTLIGSLGIYCICFVSYRYQELRTYVTEFMEPSDSFVPKIIHFQPRHAIILTQVILILATNFLLLLAPPVSCGFIMFIISIFILLIILIRFWYLEKELKKRNRKKKKRIEKCMSIGIELNSARLTAQFLQQECAMT